MTYYLAVEDGILCIERLAHADEESVAVLAETYPNLIYFEYIKPIKFYFYVMEVDKSDVQCVLPQGFDEERAAMIADSDSSVIVFGVEQ